MRLALVLLLASSTVASAVECKSARGSGGHWSYRIIAGKACWYLGSPRKPKDELHWPTKTAPLARTKTAAVEQEPEPEVEAGPFGWPWPQEGPWAPLPQAAYAIEIWGPTFEARFPEFIQGPPILIRPTTLPERPRSWGWLWWLAPFAVGLALTRYLYPPREPPQELPPGIPPWLRVVEREPWPQEDVDAYAPK